MISLSRLRTDLLPRAGSPNAWQCTERLGLATAQKQALHPGTDQTHPFEQLDSKFILRRSGNGECPMDFELEYVRSRAFEEREAAQATTCPRAREAHLRLAKMFEDHARKLQPAPAA